MCPGSSVRNNLETITARNLVTTASRLYTRSESIDFDSRYDLDLSISALVVTIYFLAVLCGLKQASKEAQRHIAHRFIPNEKW